MTGEPGYVTFRMMPAFPAACITHVDCPCELSGEKMSRRDWNVAVKQPHGGPYTRHQLLPNNGNCRQST